MFLHPDSDEQDFSSKDKVKKHFTHGEQVILSTTLYKYNKRFKRQERFILVTSKAIYNISSFRALFKLKYRVKRRIDLKKVSAISVSNISSEFVIHVPSEYDYRYASPNKRDKILLAICRAYYTHINEPSLSFFFILEIDLIKYTTTEDDKENYISRIPFQNPQALDENSLRDVLQEMDEANERLRSKTVTTFKSSIHTLSVSLNDFDFLPILGDRSFKKTRLIEMKATRELYALKEFLKKDLAEDTNINQQFKNEKFVLETSKSPFLVKLAYCFETPDKICLVKEYLAGGELSIHLQSDKKFDEQRAQFYAAELLLAIEYLHGLDIIYRNLKLENLLMDAEGHIRLSDFYISKKLEKGKLAKSMVGAPDYMAPEVINQEEYGKQADWWSFGVLLYEMLVGKTPFSKIDFNQVQSFSGILTNDVKFDQQSKISSEAKDLIEQLLIKDPEVRLGAHKGASEIKGHPWFNNIDWKKFKEKKIQPPFKPRGRSSSSESEDSNLRSSIDSLS